MSTFFDFTYNLNTQESENEILNALGKDRVKPFEPKSYFFTESSLPEQTLIGGAYGPENGNSSTRFNITTQLQLTNKKAYAVTSGQVLIFPQTGNTDKVNVFIKPLKNIDIGVPIKYFVYRGLKKELFIDENNNILEYNEQTNTPFMIKVWTDLKNLNDLSDPLPDVPARLFGFSETDAPETRVDFKFFNVYDEETTDENKIYNLPIIEAGQYFGEFADDEGGFEIVLNNGFYYQEKSDTGFEFDLNYARALRVVLDIADISSNPDISEKIYRENVQNFLDPSAFYGAHITEKNNGEIKVVDTSQKFTTKEDIYTNIVSKFYNKYKFYLYIQENRGRSFNFDGSLGTDPLKIEISGNVSPNAYQTYEWPIIISEIEQTHTNDESDDKKVTNNLTFQLKFQTTGKKAMLYNTYGNCANAEIKGNFLESDSLVKEENITTQEYTNNVDYNITNTYGIGGNTSLIVKNIASFVFLNYEEQKEVQYFNDFFGPIDIRPLIKPTITDVSNIFQKTVLQSSRIQYWGSNNYSRFQFALINSGELTPSELPEPAVDDRVRLYTLKKLNSTNPSDREFNSYLSQDACYTIVNNSDEYGAYVYGDKNYKVWKGKIKDGSEIIKSLKLINFETEGNVMSFINFGITETEFNKLMYDNEEVVMDSDYIPADATNLFFHLDPTSMNEGIEYLRYKIGIKYDLPTGGTNIIYPSAINTVYVYTLDNHYFFTEKFSEKFDFSEKFSEVEINFTPEFFVEGKFGFDWLRSGYYGEIPYKDAIISGYEEKFGVDINTQFDTKEEAFRALKREYINLPFYRDDSKVSQGYPGYPLSDKSELYYVPYLNIYPETAIGDPEPPYVAKLVAKIRIDVALTVIKYDIEYDEDLFTVELLQEFPVTGPDVDEKELTIICHKEFDKDQYIKIFATTQITGKPPEKKLAGIIKICKNSKKENRRELKVVIVSVKTQIDNTTPKNGEIKDDEIAKLKEILYQSFVYARVTNPGGNSITLNLSNDPKFKIGASNGYIQNGGIYRNKTDDPSLPGEGLFVYLNNKFHYETSNLYKNHIVAFMFDEVANKPTVAGRAQAIGKKSSVVLFKIRNNITLAHEVLHAVGLWHTHIDRTITNPDQKYTFPKYNTNASDGPVVTDSSTTDNIMSYNTMGKFTWKWQWKIIISNLKKN